MIFGNPLPGLAQDILTTHRLSAALAAEAVAACAKQGYKVTATILDADTVEQATLRGDGASTGTLDSAHDKAYTVLTLGAARNEDTSGAIAQRVGPTPSAGGLAKLPHMLLAQGAIKIKLGAEPLARSASAVRQVASLTRAAPKPVSTKSAGA